ncbi:hypothetical protein EVG20_g430 [Dentipellis fragilis]|uniref:DUF125-domain-containing protein n=1 Tax=Dentipellis fragilis TaxID=205917 RepID=A0A4Y9ZDB1_9AGAM|nr:hypothetical protein EVG20_g430 [Dentipellis fragilis]
MAFKLAACLQRLPSAHPRLPPSTPPFFFQSIIQQNMSTNKSSGASVPLPHRRDSTSATNKPPVWSVDTSITPTEPPPLPTKCSRHERGREGVCCKELKGEDERTLIDPDVVRDILLAYQIRPPVAESEEISRARDILTTDTRRSWCSKCPVLSQASARVIGLSDGLTVPFALTAGLSSLGTSKLVVLGGVAELIAGAISMGIGGFLASQAERDHYRFQRRQTAARVLRSCDGEMEREVHKVLGAVGVDQKVSREVTHCLREVEIGEDIVHGLIGSSSSSTAASDEEGGLRWSGDVGLTAFLLKFGEGLEEVPTKRLYLSALTIGMGYLVGGFIPLFPYFFIPRAHIALIYSCIMTGIVLLIFGAVKARITGAAGTSAGGYIWGAVSTLLVGGAAAAAAYGIVALMETDD